MGEPWVKRFHVHGIMLRSDDKQKNIFARIMYPNQALLLSQAKKKRNSQATRSKCFG